jgi:WD40 repeat protein
MSEELDIKILVPKWFQALDGAGLCVSSSDNCDFVACGTDSGTVYVFDKVSGILETQIKASNQSITNTCFSPDGSKLAITCEGGQGIVYDTVSWKSVYMIKNVGWMLFSIWSSNSVILFFSEKVISKYNFENQEILKTDKFKNTITGAQLLDESTFAVATYCKVIFYNLKNLEIVRQFEWQGSLISLEVSPQKNYVVCASQDNSIHIWDLKTGEDLEMTGFHEKIKATSFHRDGGIMVNSSGNTISIWDFSGKGPAGKRCKTLGPHGKVINNLKFQKNGYLFASSASDGTVLFWNGKTQVNSPLAIAGVQDQSINDSAWILNDAYFVTCTKTGYLASYHVDI